MNAASSNAVLASTARASKAVFTLPLAFFMR